jgi:hypothetical protein
MFTYIGDETRTISKLFKHTNLRISFQTTNTINHHLKLKKPATDKYNNSGIYQLKCYSYPLKYVGQTGRLFKTRFKEDIQAIRNNEINSTYAQHILNTGHTYGQLDNTMNILQIANKGKDMNTVEPFHIYSRVPIIRPLVIRRAMSERSILSTVN